MCRAVLDEGTPVTLVSRDMSPASGPRETTSAAMPPTAWWRRCAGKSLGVDKLGDVAHVEAITPQSLWERYQTLLVTAQIELYYCGSAEPERVEQAMRKALAGLPQARKRLCPECEVALHGGAEPRYVEERLDVTQGKLAMGFRTGGITCWEEDYPALTVLNALFGGTTMSRLFLNVREKLSLCYYASSTLEKMKGLLLVSSGIEFDKYDTAREEILAQLESIRRGEIEDWELEGTRSILVNGHRSTWMTRGGWRSSGWARVRPVWIWALRSWWRRPPGYQRAGGRRRPKAGAGHHLFPERTGGLTWNS